jgi:hypothetical protein
MEKCLEMWKIILIFVVPNEKEYEYQRSQRNRNEVQ